MNLLNDFNYDTPPTHHRVADLVNLTTIHLRIGLPWHSARNTPLPVAGRIASGLTQKRRLGKHETIPNPIEPQRAAAARD
jgi:hypothetical protein